MIVFSMFDAIFRFVVIYIFIVYGFASAFVLLYDNNPVYSGLLFSLLTTSISIFTGYEVPGYTNLLDFPSVKFGYFLQVLCVIIGVVLLLNFLIAMMSTIYDQYQNNSTDEYHWLMTREIYYYHLTATGISGSFVKGIEKCPSLMRFWIMYIKFVDKDYKDGSEEIFDYNKKYQLYGSLTKHYFISKKKSKDKTIHLENMNQNQIEEELEKVKKRKIILEAILTEMNSFK